MNILDVIFGLPPRQASRILRIYDSMQDLLSSPAERDLCLSTLLLAQKWANEIDKDKYNPPIED